MHVVLYTLAVACALIGAIWGVLQSQVLVVANGMLAAVLMGAIAKIVHSLDMIEGHLRRISRSQIRNALPAEPTSGNVFQRFLEQLGQK
jgi:hypothetical protein